MSAQPAICPAPSPRASLSPDLAFGACPICGAPVARGRGPRPRIYDSPACAQFANFLAAAERELGEVRFPATRIGLEAAAGVRARLFALANRIPVRWYRPRGRDGRFQRRSA